MSGFGCNQRLWWRENPSNLLGYLIQRTQAYGGCGPAEPSYMHRTEGHRNTSISSDTRVDWSEAFALLSTLQVACVWHASKFTREVLDGLLRIGFLNHQQIIWTPKYVDVIVKRWQSFTGNKATLETCN
jgi:hypothetical protein